MPALKPTSKLAGAALLPLLCLTACAEQPSPTSPRFAGYAADNAGKAAVCTAPPVAVTDGQDSTATISTGGGGWCGIPVTRQGSPLGAALLTQPARSGSVYIHLVGNETRVDYTPHGRVAADSFAVKLIPGDETMRVTVSAAAGAQ